MTSPQPQGQPFDQQAGFGQPAVSPQPGGFGQAEGFQQQPGAFPQSGAFQQAEGVSHAGFQQPWAQQGFEQGYPGFVQQGGFGDSPSSGKSKKGLWIGISSAAVVVLAAVGITGFVAPGFFVSDSPGPESTVQAIVDGLNKHDQNALTGLLCSDANPQLPQAISGVGAVSNAKATSGTKISDTEYEGGIDALYNGEPGPLTVKLANEDGKWCWKDVSNRASGS